MDARHEIQGRPHCSAGRIQPAAAATRPRAAHLRGHGWASCAQPWAWRCPAARLLLRCWALIYALLLVRTRPEAWPRLDLTRNRATAPFKGHRYPSRTFRRFSSIWPRQPRRVRESAPRNLMAALRLAHMAVNARGDLRRGARDALRPGGVLRPRTQRAADSWGRPSPRSPAAEALGPPGQNGSRASGPQAGLE